MEIDRPPAKLPIPPHATRVFSGVIFDVYQWAQELFDGSFVTYEKAKRLDTVNIIAITKEGKFIVTNQEQVGVGKFVGLAGGRAEEGEKAVDAAKRELLEETGYEASELELWDSVQLAEKTEWAAYTFIARGCVRVAEQMLDPGERIEVEEIDFDEFINLPLRQDFRDTEVILKLLRDGFVRYEWNEGKIAELKKTFLG